MGHFADSEGRADHCEFHETLSPFCVIVLVPLYFFFFSLSFVCVVDVDFLLFFCSPNAVKHVCSSRCRDERLKEWGCE